jgi:hypothetical protein
LAVGIQFFYVRLYVRHCICTSVSVAASVL